MRIVVGRIASAVVMATGWVIAGVRTVLDFIGYTTFPDDSQVAGNLIRSVLLWVMGLPIWLPWGFALITTMWLMYVSWPRHVNSSPSSDEQLPNKTNNDQVISGPDAPTSTGAEKEGVYEGAHEELMLFISNYLMPACEEIYSIQYLLIGRISDNPVLVSLARDNIISGVEEFGTAYRVLSGMNVSPAEFITFDKMKNSVDMIEKNYSRFVSQANDLARSLGVVLRDDDEVHVYWNRWRKKHEQLVTAYESIKQNSRMGKLFRPRRPSRWGTLVSINDVDEATQFLSPLDTGTGTRLRTHLG